MINETEGLDLDSWKCTVNLTSGMAVNWQFLKVIPRWISLQVQVREFNSVSSIDVDSIIPEISRQNSWDLWVWIKGQDLAGQEIDSTFNSKASPYAVLQLANRDADLRIDSEDIRLSTDSPVTNNQSLSTLQCTMILG